MDYRENMLISGFLKNVKVTDMHQEKFDRLNMFLHVLNMKNTNINNLKTEVVKERREKEQMGNILLEMQSHLDMFVKILMEIKAAKGKKHIRKILSKYYIDLEKFSSIH